MVSQSRPAVPSRVRILDAAAQEFAARGFDGAKVDRIARRARVNKAMLYYHFRSKADLYREILHDLFQGVAQAVTQVRAAGGDAESQVRRFIAAIASVALTRPHFPAIWLREIADGGRHLDDRIIADLRTVVLALAAMLRDGRRTRQFRDVPPFLTHLTIVAPLLLFSASAPIRERFAGSLPRRVAMLPRDTALQFVQDATVAMLKDDGRSPSATRRSRGRSGRRPSPAPKARRMNGKGRRQAGSEK